MASETRILVGSRLELENDLLRAAFHDDNVVVLDTRDGDVEFRFTRDEARRFVNLSRSVPLEFKGQDADDNQLEIFERDDRIYLRRL